MIYKIDMPRVGRFFMMPCAAERFMKLADGNLYKVLICALCADSDIADTNELAARAGVSVSAAEEAMIFWIGNGVISAVPTENAPAIPVQPAAVPASVIQPVSIRPAAPEKISEPAAETPPATAEQPEKKPAEKERTINHVPKTIISYSPTEIAERIRTSRELSGLFDKIQQIFGRTLNASESGRLLDLYDYLDLSVPSLLILAQFCQDMDKGKISYLFTVAKDWDERGITKYADVEKEIIRQTKQRSFEGQVKNVLYIDCELTKKQRQYIEEWVEWGFDLEMIKRAGEECRFAKSKVDWRYINGILRRWHDRNLYTIKAVENYDENRSKKKAADAVGDSGSFSVDKWVEFAQGLDPSQDGWDD